MLDKTERDRVLNLKRSIQDYATGTVFPRFTVTDFEWLTDKLIQEDDLSTKLSEELQTANEELARRAEFD